MLPGMVPVVAGGERDPYFSNVSLLLHCDGTDGSTSIVDNSPAPKVATIFGNAQLDTAQSKFGSASILLDGAGDYLSFPDSSDAFDFGAGDFTIEWWVRFNAIASSGYITVLAKNWFVSGSAGWTFAFTLGSGTRNAGLHWATDGVNSRSVSFGNWALSTNTWYHMAVCRSGSTFRAFLNGVQTGGDKSDSTTLLNNTGPLVIGSNVGGENYLNGWIDEVRITKGVARYATNFAPPDKAFPNN